MTVIGRASVVLDGDTVALTKALAGAEAAMTQAGVRMAKIGRTMMMHLSLPMLATGGMAVKMAGDFDTSMRRIEGLVGIAREQIEAWEPAIHEMAIATGRSAKEAGDALFFITSAGLRGDAALNVLNTSLRAAAAGLGETKTIADAATSAMNAYGAANMSAERAVEIITVAVREGKMEAESLAPTLGKVISVAANLGVEFEQVAGVLAVFSRTGVDAAMGTTALGALMNSLMKPSRQGAVELAKVGLSYKMLRDMLQGPTGLIDVLRLLDEKFGDNDEVMTKIVPNLRALRGMMNILGQDVATVDRIMGNVRNSQGVLNKAFAAAAAGPMLKMKIAWEQMAESMDVLGKAIFPVLVPLVQKIGALTLGLTTWFTGLSAGTKTLIVSLAGLVAATGPVIWAAGLLLKGLSSMLVVLKVFPAVLGVVRMCMVDFAASMAGAKIIGAGLSNGLYYGLKGTLMTLGNLLSPTGLVMIGMGALVYMFFRAQAAAANARREMLFATQQLEAMLAASSPERARRQLRMMDERLAAARARMGELQAQLNPLAGAVRSGFAPFAPATAQARVLADAVGDVVEQTRLAQRTQPMVAPVLGGAAPIIDPSPLERANAAAREQIGSLRESITVMERQRAILQEVVTNAPVPPPAVITPTITTPSTGDVADAIKEAMEALTEAQRQADVLGTSLGTTPFQTLTARAEAYRSAILALAGAGAAENTVLNTQGLTLGQLITQYQAMSGEVLALTKAKANLGVASEEVRRIIEETTTPLERYNATMAMLRAHLADGAIKQEQFARAAANARDAMAQAESRAGTFGTVMREAAGDALNSFIDFTVRADQSFQDFADSVIRELERIFLKMLFIRVLEAAGISIPGFTSVKKFATGGFVEPHQLAIVGEAGPELISGGRGGLTVSPMRMPAAVVAQAAAAQSGDVFHIQTTFSPAFIDGRDGERWLRERGGVITEIIIDGVRRSAAARAAIAGG